jgi:hypothetical protein
MLLAESITSFVIHRVHEQIFTLQGNKCRIRPHHHPTHFQREQQVSNAWLHCGATTTAQAAASLSPLCHVINSPFPYIHFGAATNSYHPADVANRKHFVPTSC